MLSCASVAVAAMPKLAANANATTMCVARIDFLLGCLLPGQHRVLRVHDLTSKGTALLGISPRLRRVRLMGHCSDCALSVGEWPDPQLLFSYLPQPGQPGWLDGQEEDDQGADNHELQMLDGRSANRHPQGVRQSAQQDRQPPDQGRPEKRADQAA